MNMMSVVCCTPPTTPGHKIPSSQFFDSMNPLQGLKEENDLRKSFYDPNAENEDISKSKMMKSSTPDEPHFGIVEFTPGQLPRYLGDKGNVNQGFLADTPIQTPNSATVTKNKDRKSGEGNHFRFPPTPATTSTSVAFPTVPGPDAIVLDKPPVRRNSHKAPPPPPPSADMPKKAPPPPPPKLTEPSSSTPKPITDHLLPVNPARLPIQPRKRNPSDTYVKGDSLTDDKSPATCPPRPPKPSTSQRNSPVAELSHAKPNDPDEPSAPPLPPKTYRKTFSLNA